MKKKEKKRKERWVKQCDLMAEELMIGSCSANPSDIRLLHEGLVTWSINAGRENGAAFICLSLSKRGNHLCAFLDNSFREKKKKAKAIVRKITMYSISMYFKGIGKSGFTDSSRTFPDA